MSTSVNFAVGEPFPLPILAQTDGGMFQVDKNGMMFLLQLSRTDAIAVEAFRTGEIELAVTEVDGVLFLLYRIDGIFKDGWGDAPLSLSLVKEELLPDEESLRDPTIHLYLIDTNLKILLAQRTASVPEEFAEIIRENVRTQKKSPLSALSFQKKVTAIWAEKSAADLRAMAKAAHTLPMTIGSIVH
ncbi:hypothetical protein AXF19_08385 [Selenomonas sp. oral taxon 126]|uniref:hypothetical protein n=1 Tax=Selenomonas sp. oral taxon 126 TaxID=712528 RepID=UPI000807860A|nr:hypothetical protein [Selenomonas sp. oral taxon 126]ANR70996.1 hypothetical protein AXF19_08385 [Selenomonas sp. oral taxon 126]